MPSIIDIVGLIVTLLFISTIASLVVHALADLYVHFVLGIPLTMYSEQIRREKRVKAIAATQIFEHVSIVMLMLLPGIRAQHRTETIIVCAVVAGCLHAPQIVDGFACYGRPVRLASDYRKSSYSDDLRSFSPRSHTSDL